MTKWIVRQFSFFVTQICCIHKRAQSSLFYGKHGQKRIFAEKSEKLFWVEGFLHGSVELHETRIFFSSALYGFAHEVYLFPIICHRGNQFPAFNAKLAWIFNQHLHVFLLQISKWPRDVQRNTFGWARAEVLGALVNSVFLLALCFTILVEALQRMAKDEHIHDPDLMLIVGGIGKLKPFPYILFYSLIVWWL